MHATFGEPLLFGDLGLVLIPALAHNIRVLCLDRHNSARAATLSLAGMGIDVVNVWLIAGERLIS